MARYVEDPLRQDQTISGDHGKIGPNRGKRMLIRHVTKPRRMTDIETPRVRESMYRCRCFTLATTGAARRLCINRHDIVPR